MKMRLNLGQRLISYPRSFNQLLIIIKNKNKSRRTIIESNRLQKRKDLLKQNLNKNQNRMMWK